jgi:hypothetical protein
MTKKHIKITIEKRDLIAFAQQTFTALLIEHDQIICLLRLARMPPSGGDKLAQVGVGRFTGQGTSDLRNQDDNQLSPRTGTGTHTCPHPVPMASFPERLPRLTIQTGREGCSYLEGRHKPPSRHGPS